MYDAFGFSNQAFQGADRLADHLDGLVIMPDFFEGPGIDPAIFQLGEEERGSAIKSFFSGPGNHSENTEKLLEKVVPDAKKKFPSVTSWGLIGFCWGGKLSALASSKGTPFTATIQVHPAMMTREDAEKITVPHMCLASKDEPAEGVKAYEETLGKDGVVETYTSMFHGWMGARANMEDGENRKEFERG